MRDGGELQERILVRDDATRTFVHAIDAHPLPARDVVGTIRVDDLGGGRIHVAWSADMPRDAEAALAVMAMVTGMYETGLDPLEAWHGA